MSQPPHPFVRRLIDPSDAEIEQCVDDLHNAFDGDPFPSIRLGGGLSLAPQELRANVRGALVGPGQVHVLDVETGDDVPESDIVSMVIWYPPGVCIFASEEEHAAGWNQLLASIPLALRSWWLDYFLPTEAALCTKSLGLSSYLHESWHLHLFGVLKAHQGKKYGRALFEFAEQQVRSTKSPIVVETTTEVDVAIYNHLGFQICGETDRKFSRK